MGVLEAARIKLGKISVTEGIGIRADEMRTTGDFEVDELNVGDVVYKSDVLETGAAASVGFGSIQQGFLETSNVNVVNEITNLITAQRAYEMNSKVITVSDQMSSSLNNFR